MAHFSLKDKYQHFKEWQQRPYQVAPLSEEWCDCPTCGTHYQGNFCPRCGQSSKVGRYSFRAAALLFIDVWGLGNRGMFRSLRDLLLRPGYMIRDYLSGMQMAYFPPFKMLFLLTTLSILVAHGLNITGSSLREQQRDAIIAMSVDPAAGPLTAAEKQEQDIQKRIVSKVYDIQERFPNALSLTFIVIMSSFFYIFFRKAKTLPGLRFSEFFIAMVYTANMLSIYETVMTFVCLPTELISLASVLTVIPLKQFSGFTWKRTIWSILGAFTLMLLLFFFLVVIAVICGMVFFPEYFPAVGE